MDREFLRAEFRYDRATGHLFPLCRRQGRRKFGPVGWMNKEGYMMVRVAGKTELQHRVIWLMEYGWLPGGGYEIDHINTVRYDNRLENLRVITKSQNGHNRFAKREKFDGLPANISLSYGAYRVRVRINGKRIEKGGILTLQAAIKIRDELLASVWQT